MKLVGICGSLRAASFNARLLESAQRFLPEGTQMEVLPINHIPLYDQDIDGEVKPEAVTRFKSAIADSDALLIVTPEYNYSIPGVLKNALDWASRPAFKSVLTGKPCGILSASMGPTGGVRAQAHLKQVLGGTLSPVYPAPEFCLPSAHDMFNEAGELTDVPVIKRLHRYVEEFVLWAERQTPAAQ